MWELKGNYRKNGLDSRCPMCRSEKDTAEHAFECNKGGKKFSLNNKKEKERWEIVEIYRKSKENISIDNIGEEQNILEEEDNKIEDRRRIQKVKKDRRRQKKKIQEKHFTVDEAVKGERR